MTQRKHSIVISLLFIFTTISSVVYFMNPPTVTQGETAPEQTTFQKTTKKGKRVVVYLQKMTLELREDDTLIATLPILSQGKPGSYYETIGGAYTNDYKTPLHFSSIGHVYMPYSVHVFGNYFIHGIPYYPDGKEVSSAYSGGCIRLTNENAKIVYDFVDRNTSLILTRDTETSFNTTTKASTTLSSIEMTNLMAASISLEFLTQDNSIIGTDGTTSTTRKNILPRLIKNGDTSVSHLYARSMEEKTFIDLMNQKAETLGLTSTHFINLDDPVDTTYEDYTRFMTYISTYKSYLRTLQK